MKVKIAEDVKLEHGNLLIPSWSFEQSDQTKWNWLFDYLVALDVESTGLVRYDGQLRVPDMLEIALAVVDRELQIRDKLSLVIRWEGSINALPEAVRTMHTASGLFEECKAGVELHVAEAQIVALLNKYKGTRPLIWTGFSPGVLDRPVLECHMPRVPKLLHHRTLDVSALKLFLKNFVGVDVDTDDRPHRAMPDVLASIDMFRVFCKLMSGGVSGVISMARYLEADQERRKLSDQSAELPALVAS